MGSPLRVVQPKLVCFKGVLIAVNGMLWGISILSFFLVVIVWQIDPDISIKSSKVVELAWQLAVLFGGIVILFNVIFLINFVIYTRCKWMVFSKGVQIRSITGKIKFIEWKDVLFISGKLMQIELRLSKWKSGPIMPFIDEEDMEEIAKTWAMGKYGTG